MVRWAMPTLQYSLFFPFFSSLFCLSSLVSRPSSFALRLRCVLRVCGEKLGIWGYHEFVDTLTHTITGAVIAKAINNEKIGPWGTIAGLAMGAFPDSDFVLGLFNRHFYLQYHREFTHSLLLIPFYALFFSWVLTKISRRPHFWSFYKICLPVLVSHVLLDLFTSYGTMIFSPFVGNRYSWDLVFIIDLIFSGIIIIPGLVSFFWKRKASWICRGSLIGLSIYVLLCWTQHHRAIEETKAFAAGLDEKIVGVASLPQPLSPFRWANYVETEGRVYQGFVDFLRKEPLSSVNRETEPVSGFSATLQRLNHLYDPPGKVRYQSWPKLQPSPWV
ncbi:MAG: metal-dependent hydrolase, partial [Deltaproteobacteria bacterium]